MSHPYIEPARPPRRRLVDVSDRYPDRQLEIRPYNPSPAEEFARALLTTAAELFNPGGRPVQSPRHRRELMREREEAGNLVAEPEDYEGSFAEGAGEVAGRLLPGVMLGPMGLPSLARGVVSPPPGPGEDAPLAEVGRPLRRLVKRVRSAAQRSPVVQYVTNPAKVLDLPELNEAPNADRVPPLVRYALDPTSILDLPALNRAPNAEKLPAWLRRITAPVR